MSTRLFGKLWWAFTRRKPIETDSSTSELNRCLGIVDLTALGIGSTLGVGVYIITGTVAAKFAGPSVVLSFVIAAVSSIFAGLCYAEFGALVPKAGSAYIYSYISVGELMAFIIGWNLILEYVIGTASVARAYSNYLDFMFNNSIQSFLKKYLVLPESDFFSTYPDIFAFGLTMFLTIMLVVGVKESTRFTTIFTSVNILVIIYCIIVGFFRIDTHNWNISPKEIPAGVHGGNGGFMPFGIKGLVSGAATCFYSFVGFDAIATTGEEVINPQRDIPIAVVLSLTIVTIAYCSVSVIQTLLWPYWDQDQAAPLPYVFDKVGFPFARHVITIGALAGLSTSLIGAMFPLPRILYAMGSDALIFKFLAKISPRFKTPVAATFLSGLFSATMATFFNVDQLAEMMSIGTLLAYSLVAISVLLLRYQKDDVIEWASEVSVNSPNGIGASSADLYTGSWLSRLTNSHKAEVPDVFSSKMAKSFIVALCVLGIILNGLLLEYEEKIYDFTIPAYAIVMFAVVLFLIVLAFYFLSCQPMRPATSGFRVPWVPLIPFLSIYSNSYLMIHLTIFTWYRFVVWMAFGFLIYFLYGIVKSVGYLTSDEKKRLSIDTSSNHQD